MHMQCSGRMETPCWSTFLPPSANHAIRAYRIPVSEKQVLPPSRATSAQPDRSVVRVRAPLAPMSIVEQEPPTTQHLPRDPDGRAAFTFDFSEKQNQGRIKRRHRFHAAVALYLPLFSGNEEPMVFPLRLKPRTDTCNSAKANHAYSTQAKRP